MSKGKGGGRKTYPHERRVQRYGYVAFLLTAGLGVALALRGDARLLGLEVPPVVALALLAVGALAGLVAVARRVTWLATAACGVLALGVLAAGAPVADALAYGLGIAFGLALLLAAELVHMTERYERAHRAVDTEGVPEEHINRVTDEALRTLGARVGLAALGVAAAAGLAFLMLAAGPRQWRAAAETTAPLGVAVAGLVLALVASLFILAHGAKLRLRREPKKKELLPDVAE